MKSFSSSYRFPARHYRIHRVAKGVPLEPFTLVCNDDSEAIQGASHMTAESRVEVWESDRLVARLPQRLSANEAMRAAMADPEFQDRCHKLFGRLPTP